MVEQGSNEWLMARCGKITASRFGDVMKQPRSKSEQWSDAAKTYAFDLAAERLTGTPADSPGSNATAWGHEHEPAAIAEYRLSVGQVFEPAPFTVHPEYAFVGGSPDGLLGFYGIAEVKSPYRSSVHARTVHSGQVPAEHKPQILGNLWVTGRGWCDFMSYDPRMPRGARLFVCRVERDEGYIAELAARVQQFEQFIQEILEVIRGRQVAA